MIWSKDLKRWFWLEIWIVRLWVLFLKIWILKVLNLFLKTKRLRLKNEIWILMSKILLRLFSWLIWTLVLIPALRLLLSRSRCSESSLITAEAAFKRFPVLASWKFWVLAAVLRKGAPLVLLCLFFLKIVELIHSGGVSFSKNFCFLFIGHCFLTSSSNLSKQQQVYL